MFRRVIFFLFPALVFAGSFDVPMGVSGNRLVLTVTNPDPFSLHDVRVSIIQCPDWFIPESGTAVCIDTLKPESSREASFLFYADNGEAGRFSEVVLDVTDRSGQSLGRRVIGLKTSLKENRFTVEEMIALEAYLQYNGGDDVTYWEWETNDEFINDHWIGNPQNPSAENNDLTIQALNNYLNHN